MCLFMQMKKIHTFQSKVSDEQSLVIGEFIGAFLFLYFFSLSLRHFTDLFGLMVVFPNFWRDLSSTLGFCFVPCHSFKCYTSTLKIGTLNARFELLLRFHQ